MASIGYPSSSGSSMGGSTAASGSGSSGAPAAPPASYGSSSGAGSWSGLGAGRSAHAQVVRWLSDLEKTVIVSNFEKRGWAKGSAEGACVQSLPCSTYALVVSQATPISAYSTSLRSMRKWVWLAGNVFFSFQMVTGTFIGKCNTIQLLS